MDIEKTMEFILDAQARHAAGIEELRVLMKEHEVFIKRREAAMQRHDEAIQQLDQKVVTVTDLVGRLAQAEVQHVERTTALEVNMNRLFERMDRFIQGLGGNGRKPS